MYRIEFRKKVLVNTDPQRRCYYGCHFSSEIRWTDWGVLESRVSEGRINFWKELNEYAVSERGEMARQEFRQIPLD